MCLTNPGRSQRYIRSIGRPALLLRSFLFSQPGHLWIHFIYLRNPGRSKSYIRVQVGLCYLCIPCIILTHPGQSWLYIRRDKPGQSQFYIRSVGWPTPLLHSFDILRNPGQSQRYIGSTGRPVPPLHSLYIFDEPRPVLASHQEY